jgi:hypothetical protein
MYALAPPPLLDAEYVVFPPEVTVGSFHAPSGM